MSSEEYEDASFEAASSMGFHGGSSSHAASSRAPDHASRLPHLNVERWGIEEVELWLHSRQLGHLAPKFRNNLVTGKVHSTFA
jgi:hypothetical protein